MNQIIQFVVSFCVLVPIVIGLYRGVFKRDNLRYVLILLLVSIIVELTNIIFLFQNILTLWLFNIFTICEFVLLWMFYTRFTRQGRSDRVNLFILFIFLLVAFIDFVYVNGTEKINNITVSVESITLIIYSLISFYLIMNRMLFDKLVEEPFFWINIAVLFYFSGSLFLFLFGNYLISQGNKAYMEMYKIHTFVNAVWYFFISIGFWKVKKA